MQQLIEEEAEPTTRSHRIEADEPASNSTRIARLEGKVDLLAKDVRSVLARAESSSKKLAIAKYLGTAVAGAAVTLAPTQAGAIGKLLESILAFFV